MGIANDDVEAALKGDDKIQAMAISCGLTCSTSNQAAEDEPAATGVLHCIFRSTTSFY